MDIFGANTIDPRARDYVVAAVPRTEDIVNKQNVATASISGPIATWWAGDITAALGGEYRKESTRDTHDILTILGQNSGNQLPNLSGQFHVWEAFGELNVPLLKDLSFAKYLGVNGAARYSKYSTVGSNWSWNIGAEYQPIRDLRFRGQYAKAVRAPNISELFTQPSQTFPVIRDPCNGTTATGGGATAALCRAIPGVAATIAANGSFTYSQIQLQSVGGFNSGNPNLKQESGKTLTVGAVFTPSFVPGLGVTVDYYDIKVTNAITTFGRNFTINQCLQTGDPAFCGFVHRDPNTGFILSVDQELFNIAALKNRGVDVDVNYSRALHLLRDDRLSFDLKWTHLITNSFQASSLTSPTDFAGTFGRGSSRDSAFLRASYKFGIVTLGWQTDYLSGGPLIRGLDQFEGVFNKLNEIHDYWTHDLQVRFDPDKRYTLYFNVDNVFNKKPDLAPNAFFGNPPVPVGLETPQDEDVFGRRFLAGVRVKFL
jgi:outer membrane receptor protein involved in Fe transport